MGVWVIRACGAFGIRGGLHDRDRGALRCVALVLVGPCDHHLFTRQPMKRGLAIDGLGTRRITQGCYIETGSFFSDLVFLRGLLSADTFLHIGKYSRYCCLCTRKLRGNGLL